MPQNLLSVEDVAARLGLHVRTVRAYIRNGKLRAARIGKQYRVLEGDLETLLGHPDGSAGKTSASARPHVDASGIIEVDDISAEDANRVITMLTAMANSRRGAADPLRLKIHHTPDRRRLKIIVIGGLAAHLEFYSALKTILEGLQ